MHLTKNITISKLVLLVYGFITVTGNYKFFTEAAGIYPIQENAIFVGSLFFWLFSFLSTALLLVCYRFNTKFILITLLLCSSVISYFSDNYGIVFDENMIANVFVTNMSESFDLLSFKLLLYFVLLGLIPAIYVYRLEIVYTSLNKQVWQKIKYITLLVIVFVGISLLFSKSYASLLREHKQLRLYINPSYYVYALGKHINSQFKTIATPFKIIGQDAAVNRDNKVNKLIILVVGETARADRMSLNGYSRATNPLLSQQDIINFSQMYSCGTDTELSVPCMFSQLTREEYSHELGKNTSNLLDVLSYADVKVLWRDNNSSSKGVADRVEYEDYRSSDRNVVCDIECRDEGMLSDLQGYVDNNLSNDIVVILHTMGSHGPAYYKRYPKSFESFLPVCTTNQFNECTNEQINNAYDNTIVYTDYFLNNVIEFLKNNQRSFTTAMFYMSDHGESLGEGGLYLHGMPYFIAPKEQTHVASVLWLDDNFSKEVDTDELRNIANNELSHDGLFHAMLGLMDIKTRVYDKELDFIPYAK
jgi:lipid A ethanolaminephosphotransferase